MTDPRRIGTAAFALAAAALLVIVVLWLYPGLLAGESRCPTAVAHVDSFYCTQTLELPPPHISPSQNYSGPAMAADCQGFFFDLRFNWTPSAHPALPWLTGWVEEPNKTNYSVRLIVPELSNGANWTSPDAKAIVDWVAVVDTPSGTQYNSWNVTIGVESGYG
jgi:hypothetical protein